MTHAHLSDTPAILDWIDQRVAEAQAQVDAAYARRAQYETGSPAAIADCRRRQREAQQAAHVVVDQEPDTDTDREGGEQ